MVTFWPGKTSLRKRAPKDFWGFHPSERPPYTPATIRGAEGGQGGHRPSLLAPPSGSPTIGPQAGQISGAKLVLNRLVNPNILGRRWDTVANLLGQVGVEFSKGGVPNVAVEDYSGSTNRFPISCVHESIGWWQRWVSVWGEISSNGLRMKITEFSTRSVANPHLKGSLGGKRSFSES